MKALKFILVAIFVAITMSSCGFHRAGFKYHSPVKQTVFVKRNTVNTKPPKMKKRHSWKVHGCKYHRDSVFW